MSRIHADDTPKNRSNPMHAAASASSTYPHPPVPRPGVAASTSGTTPPAAASAIASARRTWDSADLARLSRRYQSTASCALASTYSNSEASATAGSRHACAVATGNGTVSRSCPRRRDRAVTLPGSRPVRSAPDATVLPPVGRSSPKAWTARRHPVTRGPQGGPSPGEGRAGAARMRADRKEHETDAPATTIPPMTGEQRMLAACRRERVDRTPVWFMRQAGRCLAGYRELRERYDILTITRTPELCAAVTRMPVDELGVD